jgi:hypothetical protein
MNMRAFGTVVLAAAVIACAGAGAAPRVVEPQIEAEKVAASVLERPLEIVFDWTLQEREARFAGQGVARIAPPHHARVDLFGPRGEAYLAAVLVDFELRLPQGVGDVPLPPPSLFWSVLGVFRPPPGARLAATARNGEGSELEYEREDDVWKFRFHGDRLDRAEWVGSSDGRRTVEISGDASHGLPTQAVYRDWPAFRELRLTVKRVLEVDDFPAEIWVVRGG